jgi:hypothetical protein
MDNGVEALVGLSARMVMRLNSMSTDRASAAKCYSDICASHMTRGAVGGLSEGCNLSFLLIPVTSTGMRKSNKPPRAARISTGLRSRCFQVGPTWNMTVIDSMKLRRGMRVENRIHFSSSHSKVAVA